MYNERQEQRIKELVLERDITYAEAEMILLLEENMWN